MTGMNNGSTDAFLAKVRERLDALSRDDAALAAQEEGVKRKRAELQQAIADLRKSMDLYRDLMEIGETSAPGQISVTFQPAEGTLGDLAFQALQDHGGRGRIIQIVHWLQEMGRMPKDPTKAQAQYSSVYTALLRDARKTGRVRQSARGEFVTAETAPQAPLPSA